MAKPSSRRGGRPSKGERKRFDAELPADLADLVRQDAKARRMSFPDWFTEAAREKLGLTDRSTQETLPLQAA